MTAAVLYLPVRPSPAPTVSPPRRPLRYWLPGLPWWWPTRYRDRMRILEIRVRDLEVLYFGAVPAGVS